MPAEQRGRSAQPELRADDRQRLGEATDGDDRGGFWWRREVLLLRPEERLPGAPLHLLQGLVGQRLQILQEPATTRFTTWPPSGSRVSTNLTGSSPKLDALFPLIDSPPLPPKGV